MSNFKVEMHQIRFRLLCPRPRSGSLQRSPDPYLDLRGLTSKGIAGGRVGLLQGLRVDRRPWGEGGRGREVEFPHLFNPTLTTECHSVLSSAHTTRVHGCPK